MANNNNYVIQTENLSKRFGGLVAVNRISMKFKEGEIMGLIGPNGAGKKNPERSCNGTAGKKTCRIYTT